MKLTNLNKNAILILATLVVAFSPSLALASGPHTHYVSSHDSGSRTHTHTVSHHGG